MVDPCGVFVQPSAASRKEVFLKLPLVGIRDGREGRREGGREEGEEGRREGESGEGEEGREGGRRGVSVNDQWNAVIHTHTRWGVL